MTWIGRESDTGERSKLVGESVRVYASAGSSSAVIASAFSPYGPRISGGKSAATISFSATAENPNINVQDAIDAEDKSKPLTDQKLVEILKQKGFTLARRTVAKYREQLNIPVARLRKEL